MTRRAWAVTSPCNPLVGDRVERHLAGDEDEAVRLGSNGIRAHGRHRALDAMNLLAHDGGSS